MDGPDTSFFYGTFTPRLDDKGRLTLPARFRPHFEGGIVMTLGQTKCLYGMTLGEFKLIENRIRELPFTSEVPRNFVRMFYGGMTREIPDKQGRVGIPAQQREWASLDKECVVVGAMNRIEIWDSARWAEFQSSQEDTYSELGGEVMPGIF